MIFQCFHFILVVHISPKGKSIKIFACRESIIAIQGVISNDANDDHLVVKIFPGHDLEVLASIRLVFSFQIMLKHFKMYITITDIIAEKWIDPAYLIQGKEVAIVSVFSDNIQYEFTEPWMIELELGNKQIMAGTSTKRN